MFLQPLVMRIVDLAEVDLETQHFDGLLLDLDAVIVAVLRGSGVIAMSSKGLNSCLIDSRLSELINEGVSQRMEAKAIEARKSALL